MLKSAQVTSLVAIYFPTLFKHFSARFAFCKKAFDDTRDLMKSAINDHVKKRNKGKEDMNISNSSVFKSALGKLVTTSTDVLS